ncbi:MAG: hypothetical protein QM697_01230 [Lachnospiraceae bacterium]
MNEWIAAYLTQFTGRFFLNQFFVVLAVYLAGLFLVACMRRGVRDFWTPLLAYPVGIAVYVLAGFLLLVTGLPFRAGTVLLLLLFAAVLLCFYKKPFQSLRTEFATWKEETNGQLKRRCVPWLLAGALLLAAVLAVSGILSVSLSNDSMYYYSLYSRALVSYGTYRREFNVFLTDVGQGAALIGTFPYLFGFNEMFGIQQFFNLNFLCCFTYAVYEQTKAAGQKKAFVVALLSLLVLLSAMPFLIVSKWAMANVYFMEYLFLCSYLAFRFQPKEEGCEEGLLLVQGILMAMLSTLRMEGGIFVLFAVLCISTLKYRNRELALCFLVPTACLQLLYGIRIFLTMDINAPYTFLTEKKAAVQLLGMAAVLLYLTLIRGRYFKTLQKHIEAVIMAGLLLVNAGLCVLDFTIYFGNLKAFGANLFHQSGWGLFPAFVIAMLLLLPKKGIPFRYHDLLWTGYLLITLAVCWARDGILREGVGDSGNRVLLQIVPLVVFALTLRAARWCRK